MSIDMNRYSIIKFSTVIIFCLFSTSYAQRVNTSFTSSGTMSYQNAFNSLNTESNTKSSGLAMGGLSSYSSNSTVTKGNYSGNLNLFQPRNQTMGINYKVQIIVDFDLIAMKINALKTLLAAKYGSIKLGYKEKQALESIYHYKFKDISDYAPLTVMLEFSANPPVPVFRYALKLQFAATQLLHKAVAEKEFRILR
jgi:hypothetical protein